MPRNECPFYSECLHALHSFTQLKTGLSESRLLSIKALNKTLVPGSVRVDSIGELGMTKEEGHLLWPRDEVPQ